MENKTCEECGDVGWIFARSCGEYEFQRCDACERYEGDLEAHTEAVRALELATSRMNRTSSDRFAKRHLEGILEVVKAFKPNI